MKLLGEGINTRGSFCKNGKCNIVLQSLSQGHLVYQVLYNLYLPLCYSGIDIYLMRLSGHDQLMVF